LQILIVLILTLRPLPIKATNTYTFWAFADIQPTNSSQWDEWYSVIDDMENVDFNTSLVAGDIVTDGDIDSDYITYINSLGGFEQDQYLTAGNHDYQDNGKLTNYNYYFGSAGYTVIQGNILFIFINSGRDDYVTEKRFNYWRNRVINNQDKIIITVTHRAIQSTTRGSGVNYITNSDQFIEVMEQYHVDMWLHGHIHQSLEQTKMVVKKYGTVFVNTGLALPQLYDECSRTLNFIEGSPVVEMKLRNHQDNIFNDTWIKHYTLSHNFSL